MEKNGKEYLDELFTHWVSCMQEARASRAFAAHREQMKDVEEAHEAAMAEKASFLDMGTKAKHVLEAAMKQLQRANDAEAVGAMSSAWGGWCEVLAAVRKAKQVAEEQQRARILAASARCDALNMAMRSMGSAMLGTSMHSWQEELALTKKTNLLKKQGMARGMRAIQGSQ